jgi:hypothetical protein
MNKIELRRKKDRERKQQERRQNTDYAKRVRESKRSEKSKARRNELRQRPEQKEKERLYALEYRKRPEAKAKNHARYSVNMALAKGILVRPLNCEICGKPDIKLRDGRSSLRADHYLGYEPENYLNVKFICIECDGKQLRKEYNYE